MICRERQIKAQNRLYCCTNLASNEKPSERTIDYQWASPANSADRRRNRRRQEEEEEPQEAERGGQRRSPSGSYRVHDQAGELEAQARHIKMATTAEELRRPAVPAGALHAHPERMLPSKARAEGVRAVRSDQPGQAGQPVISRGVVLLLCGFSIILQRLNMCLMYSTMF